MTTTGTPGPGTRTTRRARRRWPALVAAVALLTSACSGGSPAAPSPTTSVGTGSASGSASVSRSASPAPSGPTSASPPVEVTGVSVAGSVGGFARPWDLRFLPDGTPLVTERTGTLAAIVDGRRRVVAAVPGVVARGEGGLLGLALDPGFATNRRIYLCLAHGSDGRVEDVRVVRYRISAALDAISDGTPLVTGIPAGAGNRHLGCRVEVGPDGMLWIATGDAVEPRAPQDPRSRAGKVLRATLDGEPAPGNPGGDWDPYVFTLGHRNVQGLAFRPDDGPEDGPDDGPEDGTAFSVEHGTGCDDEVNVLRAGANYGWDPVGPRGGYAEDAPMTDPDVDGAVAAAWSSGCPTIAPSGATFITGEGWGDWQGRLAVAVLKDRELMVATVDGQRVTDTRVELQGALGRLRTVRNAPDGSLWVTVDASPGEVVRVIPRTG